MSLPAPTRRAHPVGFGLPVWFAVGVAVAFAVWVAGSLPLLPPLPGRGIPDDVTAFLAVVAELVARLAALASLGGSAAVAFLSRDARREVDQALARRWIGRAAQVWFVAAATMTVAHPAYVLGVDWAAILRTDTWWTAQTATRSGLAWSASALVAVGTIAVAYRGRRPGAFALAWLAGVLAHVFVAVTGNVTVGLDHDWATDAAVVAGAGISLLGSLAVGAVLAGTPEAVRRYRSTQPLLVVAALVAEGVVAWQLLAGTSPLATPFGLPVLGIGAVYALFLVSRIVGRRALPRLDVALAVAYAAFAAAASHLPPPRFWVPQSIQVNYLGYEVGEPATLPRLLGLGRPNLLWVFLGALALGLYAWGVVRVHRRGGRWPVLRSLSWLLGWGITTYLAVSGLWTYSTAVFSWHMLVHMTVNMLVPILCVLGAPFTLLDRAAREREPRDLPGLRELLTALGESPAIRWLLSPPVLWVVYVGSLYLVYFTPLFAWLMRAHWAHQLMLLHFMAAGYGFFSLVIGVDRQPWRLPPLVKFALLLSVMPFHAIFAVGLMSARDLIGGEFYRSLDVTWVGDLMADQNVAGQLTWLTGEVPMFIAVIALAAQWFGRDTEEASEADALADDPESDPLSAYNELLAQLADLDARDGRAER